MITFLQEKNLCIVSLLFFSLLPLSAYHVDDASGIWTGGPFKGISLDKTPYSPDSSLDDSLDSKQLTESLQDNDYHLIMKNLNNISGSDADIVPLRKLIAITFVEHKTEKLQSIITILASKKGNILQNVFDLAEKENNFFEYLFQFYYRKKRYTYASQGKLDSGSTEWKKEKNQLFNESWATLLQLSQDKKFTIHIDAKGFLACCAAGNQQLFDQFLRWGDEQHKNDNQYWLNRSIQWKKGKQVYSTTMLYEYINSHFFKRDNLRKLHKGGIYTEYIYNSLIEKTKSKNNSKPQIDMLKNNDLSENSINVNSNLLVPMAVYYKLYAASFLGEHIMIYYKRDCQKVFNELKKKGVLSGVKTLKELQSINLLNEKEHAKKKLKVTYITALRKEPTLSFLNYSANREGVLDSISATFVFGRNKKKEEVNMSFILPVLKALTKFEGIMITEKHYKAFEQYYNKKKPYYKEENNCLLLNRELILEIMDDVKKSEFVISRINKENKNNTQLTNDAIKKNNNDIDGKSDTKSDNLENEKKDLQNQLEPLENSNIQLTNGAIKENNNDIDGNSDTKPGNIQNANNTQLTNDAIKETSNINSDTKPGNIQNANNAQLTNPIQETSSDIDVNSDPGPDGIENENNNDIDGKSDTKSDNLENEKKDLQNQLEPLENSNIQLTNDDIKENNNDIDGKSDTKSDNLENEKKDLQNQLEPLKSSNTQLTNDDIKKNNNDIDGNSDTKPGNIQNSNTQLANPIQETSSDIDVNSEPRPDGIENENNTQNLLDSLGNYFGNIYVWITSILIIGAVTAATFIFYRLKKVSKGNKDDD